MVAQAAEFFEGRIDLFFNNAGRVYNGSFESFTNEDWEGAFALNFYAEIYTMRAVLPIMKTQGEGQVINIISGAAFSPLAYWAPYTATKAALNALSLVLRSEYWDDGIKISSATPGTTRTAIWDQVGEVPPTAMGSCTTTASSSVTIPTSRAAGTALTRGRRKASTRIT